MQTTSVTVGVPVSDLARSRAWYDRLFEQQVDLEPAAGVVEYEVGAVWVQLHEAPAAGGCWALRFGVEDVDGERSRLVALGLQPTEIEDIPGAVRIFDLADPDGNRLSFYRVLQ